MLILLYGPDSYRRQEKLKEIVSDYKKKHSSLSIQHFNLADDADTLPFRDFLKANSLFDAFKLGIISGGEELDGAEDPSATAMAGRAGSGEGKEFRKSLKDNLEKKESVLILLFNKKPTKEYGFLLKKPAIFQEFENLAGAELQKFFHQETKKRNLNLDEESQNLLARIYAGNSWGLITELDKLALLNENNISEKVLKNHLEASLPVNVFETINQIRNSGSLSARLSLLEELFSRSKDSAMIFNILAVSPYADQKWKSRIADYDVAVKSGKLEYEEALTELVLG